jgi:hypothetical protein
MSTDCWFVVPRVAITYRHRNIECCESPCESIFKKSMRNGISWKRRRNWDRPQPSTINRSKVIYFDRKITQNSRVCIVQAIHWKLINPIKRTFICSHFLKGLKNLKTISLSRKFGFFFAVHCFLCLFLFLCSGAVEDLDTEAHGVGYPKG